MGVKGLWQLLLPTGRRISIETLTGKILAIDASIWLTQFIKVNRDPETGKVQHPSAHLIGFFRRICKLLYHGIKPVFVFDGATPEIKMREIYARRKRRENTLHGFGLGSAAAGGGSEGAGGSNGGSNDGVKRLAKRLLVQNLKKHRELERKMKQDSSIKSEYDDGAIESTNTNDNVNGASGGGGAFASGFQLPNQNIENNTQNSSNDESNGTKQKQDETTAKQNNNELLDINKIISETKDFLEQNDLEKKNTLPQQKQQNDWDNAIILDDDQADANNNDDDDSSTHSYHIPQNENDLSTEVLSSLPTKTRVDVIEKAKRQQRMQSRKEFMSVAANPDSYSQCQLRNFLKSANLSKKINNVGKMVSKNKDDGEMIASDSTKRFIFTKDVEEEEEEDDKEVEGYNKVFDTFDTNNENHYLTKKQKFSDVGQNTSSHKRRRLVKFSDINTKSFEDDDENEFMDDPNHNYHTNTPLQAFNDDNDGAAMGDSEDEAGGFIREDDTQDKFDKSNTNHQKKPEKVMICLSSDESTIDGEGEVNDSTIDNKQNSRKDQDISKRLDDVGDLSKVEGTSSNEQYNNTNNIELSSDDDDDDDDYGGGFIVEENDKKVVPNEQIDHDSNLGGGFINGVNQEVTNDINSNPREEKTCIEVRNDSNTMIEQNLTHQIHQEQAIDDSDEDIAWEDCEADGSVSPEQHGDCSVQIGKLPKTNDVTQSIPSASSEPVAKDMCKIDDNESDYSNIEWEDCADEKNFEVTTFDTMNEDNEIVENRLPSPPTEDANSLALKRAQATAANFADWAGRAVKRAISAHLNESNTGRISDDHSARSSDTDIDEDVDDGEDDNEDGKNEKEKEIDIKSSTFSVENKSIEIDEKKNSNSTGRESVYFDTSLEALHEEEAQIREDLYKRERDMDTITDDMIEDVILLLQLFGIPYVKSPTEAEAQCATLEKLGLVDGVCTEDSDALVFGSKCVYKNIFDDKKFVEVYLSKDAEKLGIGLKEKIALAMLLGGDYTEGVRGVGIVNGMEILQAFPVSDGVREGLTTFKNWLDGNDLFGDGENLQSEKERKFHKKHKSARLRWVVPKDFPSKKVFQAYSHPVVDTSSQKFSFGTPDDERIKLFCRRKMGWDSEEVDRAIQPVLQKIASDSVRQTRLDGYFMRYEDNHTISHKIKSKRLKEVFDSVNKSET